MDNPYQSPQHVDPLEPPRWLKWIVPEIILVMVGAWVAFAIWVAAVYSLQFDWPSVMWHIVVGIAYFAVMSGMCQLIRWTKY